MKYQARPEVTWSNQIIAMAIGFENLAVHSNGAALTPRLLWSYGSSMTETQATFADPAISREEWSWVQELIGEVERDARREAFAKGLFQWDLAVKQFRKLEQRRMLLQSPTPEDLRNHAICLHALLAIGHALVLESKKFKPEELERFQVRHDEVEAYVEDLKHSLAEWHHGFGDVEVAEARKLIFGGAA